MPDPKEDIYEEPPDEVIKGVHATGKMEKLPATRLKTRPGYADFGFVENRLT